VGDILRIRASVRENRLVSREIGGGEVLEAITGTGRGWVVEMDGHVIAFAVGNAATGNVWALFVHPEYEGQGHGRALHDTMIDWLWTQGVERAWLTTEPGTRAQRFYERAGWQTAATAPHGEVRYELCRPPTAGPQA